MLFAKRKGHVPRFMLSRAGKKLDHVKKYMLPRLQLCWLHAVLMQFPL